MTSINKDIKEATSKIEKQLQRGLNFGNSASRQSNYSRQQEKKEEKVITVTVPDVETKEKLKQVEVQLKLALERAEKAELKLIDKEKELKQAQEGSTSVINEYERIISQMTSEVNSQVETNKELKEQIKKIEKQHSEKELNSKDF